MKNLSVILSTEIIIDATAKEVWNVLSDLEKYSSWNPFITNANGFLIENRTLEITAGGMKFKPKVLKAIPEKEVKWLGKFYFAGLFDGEHSFELIEINANQTKFIHSEKFKGILVPLFKKKLNTETKAGFIEMNEALKNRVEGLIKNKSIKN